MHIIIVIIILAIIYGVGMVVLASLNFETGFYVLAGIAIVIGIFSGVQSNKEEGTRQEESKSNAKFFIIAGIFFGICGILTPMAIEKTQQNKKQVETYKQEQAEKDRLKAEEEIKQRQEKEQKEREAEKQAEGAIRAWCSNMRLLMTDTDEQWEHWWPIATGSHDVVTGYDAANTLNLNLKQYLKNLDGTNYKIPEHAEYAKKSKMNEIYKKFRDSLWKRILASEKYAKALKSGNFDMKESEGIRRRAIEAETVGQEASNLLRELGKLMGME